MNGAQIQFIGNLTRDPVIRYIKDRPEGSQGPEAGTPYVTIGVGVNRYRGPNADPYTIYFNVSLWGRQGESCMRNCKLGTTVYIQGPYTFREYVRADGAPGYSHDVRAFNFRAFPNANANPAQDEDPDTPAPGYDAEAPEAAEPPPELEPEDAGEQDE